MCEVVCSVQGQAQLLVSDIVMVSEWVGFNVLPDTV